MATTADLEAAFEDAVLKLKNAHLDWITAKSEGGTDEEGSESSDQDDIEDYTQNESVDITANAGQSSENEYELRPVWFIPNIFQLRPILGYSTNEQANLDTGYSTCSDHEKIADHFNTDESQGTTTLKPINVKGQYTPYFDMYYGSDGQVYGYAKKLSVRAESTERSSGSVEDLGTESVDASNEVEVEGTGRSDAEAEYQTEEVEEVVGVVAGGETQLYPEEEEEYNEEDNEEDEYYVYADAESQDVEEKPETIDDIEYLVAYNEGEDEEQEVEYYADEGCAADYEEEEEDAGYSEEAEDEAAYAQYDEAAHAQYDEDAGQIVTEDLHECEAEQEPYEVQEDAEPYAEYEAEGEEEDEEYEVEVEEAEKEEDYDEACEDAYQDAYEEAEYSTDAVAGAVEYEEVPKEVHYAEKNLTKDRGYDNYLPHKPMVLGGMPVGTAPIKPGIVGYGAEASDQAKAYSFYKNDEEEDAQAATQYAGYPNGYVDAYGNPCIYNPLYVPVNGYY